ncbi:MAG: putative sulfate exporter family transporter [Armatimonadetes bacterium]|nr:putative sulfate exporter family transporter [Armatimonadota bacterium]
MFSNTASVRVVFWGLCLLCLVPLLPLPSAVGSLVAPIALLSGVALALTVGNPYPVEARKWSKNLLQMSVVILGFSMDVGKVAKAGQSGLIFSLVSITGIFLLGWALCRRLGMRSVTGFLVSAGTAICGGSAIAAVSSVIDAPEEDISVAVGTVFVLNALVLLVFPPIGHFLGLSQRQFGFWSGIAIHDIASVVGAGASYGPVALDEATAVKLSRVLYLVPVIFVAKWIFRRQGKTGQAKGQIPWFVAFFLLAAALRTFIPAIHGFELDFKRVATTGFALALFLIGTGLRRETLRSVGVKPLLLGTTLWLTISVATLLIVRLG